MKKWIKEYELNFVVKNGIKCFKTLDMLTVVFVECILSQKSFYKRYKRFKKGREDVDDDEQPEDATTSTNEENIETVKNIVLENRRITIREVGENVGILSGSCYSVFSNVLRMKRVAAKLVLKLLNFEQKQCRIRIAQSTTTATKIWVCSNGL